MRCKGNPAASVGTCIRAQRKCTHVVSTFSSLRSIRGFADWSISEATEFTPNRVRLFIVTRPRGDSGSLEGTGPSIPLLASLVTRPIQEGNLTDENDPCIRASHRTCADSSSPTSVLSAPATCPACDVPVSANHNETFGLQRECRKGH